MSEVFLEYFRCPEGYVRLSARDSLSDRSGFFRFGSGAVGYGKYAGHLPADSPRGPLRDAWQDVDCSAGSVSLPFDLEEVVGNLRLERYTGDQQYGSSKRGPAAWAYYALRPLLPVSVRRHLQRAYLGNWDRIAFPKWPLDHSVDSIMRKSMQLLLRTQKLDRIPFIWFWPQGATSSLCMTHDVETKAGRDFCESLMSLNESFGIAASFQIVPEERYEVNEQYLDSIRRRGFEVNVQDLNHDGRLYNQRDEFSRRAVKINEYGRRYRASGFRAAILYRRQEWYPELEFDYDMSVPNVAHLDPQRGGCCTIFPYFVGRILELPLTTTQDYSLFHVLRQHRIDLWKDQAKLVIERHGLLSLLTHPDYLLDHRAQTTYKELLAFLAELRSRENTWIALPNEVNQWWRNRSAMSLVRDGHAWRIEGPGKERARLAYIKLDGDRLFYSREASACVA